MTDAPVREGMMTVEEFIRRYDREGPFEIIEGEIVELSPIVFGHGETTGDLLFTINNFTLPRNLGKAYMETPFVMPDTDASNWVKGSRVPDLMYIRADRLAAYKAGTPDYQSLPLMIVPDLVVEVVSPGDSYSEVDRKVERYLNDGVQLVWVLDPQRKKVSVHLPDSKQQTNFSGADMLTGGEVIPGFEITAASIFE